jgi:Ca2+-binding EF-hand superfamily protein
LLSCTVAGQKKNDMMSREKLFKNLKLHGFNMTTIEEEEVFKGFDVDGDGFVSFQDFEKVLNSYQEDS